MEQSKIIDTLETYHLPCQSRTCNLWEFDPAKHQTLQHFFGVTHEGILKVLFQANESG